MCVSRDTALKCLCESIALRGIGSERIESKIRSRKGSNRSGGGTTGLLSRCLGHARLHSMSDNIVSKDEGRPQFASCKSAFRPTRTLFVASRPGWPSIAYLTLIPGSHWYRLLTPSPGQLGSVGRGLRSPLRAGPRSLLISVTHNSSEPSTSFTTPVCPLFLARQVPFQRDWVATLDPRSVAPLPPPPPPLPLLPRQLTDEASTVILRLSCLLVLLFVASAAAPCGQFTHW